jgi:RNA polymerase sigma-70 factor, ECF subfamily
MLNPEFPILIQAILVTMFLQMAEDDLAEQQEREWIRRMASKDANALDAFYSRYNRLAFSLVFRIVGNREDAEDVLTDVFWQVWQQSSRYDGSRGKPVAWLLTIARSRAIDRLRSRGRHEVTTDDPDKHKDPPAPAEPDPFVQTDMRQAVHDALQSLPEQQRIALEMAYFQGMTHTEIAAALGQPLGTVKDRIRTGMMHLRKRLRPYL